MKSEQKTVAIGAATGVLSMIALVWILSHVLVSPVGMETLAARIAFTLQLNVLAVMPLFIMLITVGNSRFLSDAIDPTRHKESSSMEIDGRVVDNTLQQNFVFFLGSLALSTVLASTQMQVMLALTIVFIFARCVFWIGYRINPLYRAPGMAGTAYMNLGILLATAYLAFV